MSKQPSPSGRMRGQTVLVTGTTKGGIGYETARLLGDEGATVLTHGRTPEAAGASVDNLAVDGNGAGRFIPVAADLSSIAGAQQLADAARAAAPQGIHGLVNNAGAGFNERRLSPDGFEMTMAINHIAVAALTDGLLDLLHAGADFLGRHAGSQHDRVNRGARESRDRLVLSGQVQPDSGLLQRQVDQPALRLCPGSPTRRPRGHGQRSQPRQREIGFRRQGRRNLRADGTIRRTAIRPPQQGLPRSRADHDRP
jgi:NAD(P)-dependent dehydrogenase (short-subunit alcohol dehydrogenase family)